jgi:hypothetical protein
MVPALAQASPPRLSSARPDTALDVQKEHATKAGARHVGPYECCANAAQRCLTVLLYQVQATRRQQPRNRRHRQPGSLHSLWRPRHPWSPQLGSSLLRHLSPRQRCHHLTPCSLHRVCAVAAAAAAAQALVPLLLVSYALSILTHQTARPISAAALSRLPSRPRAVPGSWGLLPLPARHRLPRRSDSFMPRLRGALLHLGRCIQLLQWVARAEAAPQLPARAVAC